MSFVLYSLITNNIITLITVINKDPRKMFIREQGQTK